MAVSLMTEHPHGRNFTKEQLEAKLAAQVAEYGRHVCEDCIKTGSFWVRLRACLECGYIGCCESSVNQHAHKHFVSTTLQKHSHSLIQSVEPGESWVWCYIHGELVKEDAVVTEAVSV